MASAIFPSQTKVVPSFSEPSVIVQYAQPSGAFETLPEGKPLVKLGEGDWFVYINRLNVRTQALASQFNPSMLPSATLNTEMFSTQTYSLQVRCEYGRDDMAAASNYALALPQVLDFANRQGIYQGMRSMLLYGLTPGNAEGLLNTVGATAVTLPPDTNGNTTFMTWDNGQMAEFLLKEVTNLIISMYQTTKGQKAKIVILSPQRIGVQMLLGNIVQVTSYQRQGAGTSTVGHVVNEVAKQFGDQYEIVWYYDDTLIGKGAGGTDMIILTMPEIDTPAIPGVNTNIFGQVEPHNNAVNTMYADMAAPMKIPTPIPDGAITEVQRLRVTCGWNLRPQGLVLISMQYS